MTTTLTIERLYAAPSLSGPTPTGVKFSPDGKRVTFLKSRPDEPDRFDLWQFDVATGAPSLLIDSKQLEAEEVELSEEEKALRERKRIAGRKGIVDYDWGNENLILIPVGGNLFCIALTPEGPQVQQLTDHDDFDYDARVSPDGSRVSFVRNGAVYGVDLESGVESRLTPAADPDAAISYGVAEFVAQEEMSRYTGYWWSRDGRYLAYTRVNESTVDIIPRFDIAAEEVTVISQRYPRAGRPNAIVDLFLRDTAHDDVVQIDWHQPDFGDPTDQYLARVNWAQGRLHYQLTNREQSEKRWRSHSPDNWEAARHEPTERQVCWVNLSDDFASAGQAIIYSSEEETGFRHLYIHDPQTGHQQQITMGEWAVSQIEGISADQKTLYFTGFADTSLEKHLYQCPLPANADASNAIAPPTRMTEDGKTWAINFSPDGQSYVGTSSSPARPPQTGLYRTDGSLIAWIEENALNDQHAYAPYRADHVVPEYGTLAAEDGQTLHFSMLKPPGFDPAKQYPVIIEVYGGPHVQTVTRGWQSLSDQYYAQQGYIVFRLDNRGSANRGKQFEDVIYRQTGGPEVQDQLAGVSWLASQPFVDADRIAIQGWSYGGYMTLMTLLQAPEGTFAAAVSGAPVTDWSLYDTFYTERYMDTPQDNAEGYEASSVFYHLERLDGTLPPLLLAHGMADDNVTFDNTTRLMASLQQKGILFDLMTYPGQRHGIRGEALQTHLMKTRMTFLNRHLKGGQT